MKVISTCLVLVMIVSSAALLAGAPAAQQAPPKQAPQEKVFEGALVDIDSAAHMLTVTGTDNKEWLFTYTDKTEITGSEKSIQGLAGKSGTRLKITYRVENAANQATRIEIVPDR